MELSPSFADMMTEELCLSLRDKHLDVNQYIDTLGQLNRHDQLVLSRRISAIDETDHNAFLERYAIKDSFCDPFSLSPKIYSEVLCCGKHSVDPLREHDFGIMPNAVPLFNYEEYNRCYLNQDRNDGRNLYDNCDFTKTVRFSNISLTIRYWRNRESLMLIKNFLKDGTIFGNSVSSYKSDDDFYNKCAAVLRFLRNNKSCVVSSESCLKSVCHSEGIECFFEKLQKKNEVFVIKEKRVVCASFEQNYKSFQLISEVGQWSYDHLMNLFAQQKIDTNFLFSVLEWNTRVPLTNWKKKRLLTDVSFILVNCGKKPLPGLDKKVKPHYCLVKAMNERSKTAGTFRLRNNKPKGIKEEFWEDVSKSDMGEKDKKKFADMKMIFECIDPVINKLESEISNSTKKVSAVKKNDLRAAKKYKDTLMNVINDKYLIHSKMEDDYPTLCGIKCRILEQPVSYAYREAVLKELYAPEINKPTLNMRDRIQKVLEVKTNFIQKNLIKNCLLQNQIGFSSEKKKEFNDKMKPLKSELTKMNKMKKVDEEEVAKKTKTLDEYRRERGYYNNMYNILIDMKEESVPSAIDEYSIIGACQSNKQIKKNTKKERQRRKMLSEGSLKCDEFTNSFIFTGEKKIEKIKKKKESKLLEAGPSQPNESGRSVSVFVKGKAKTISKKEMARKKKEKQKNSLVRFEKYGFKMPNHQLIKPLLSKVQKYRLKDNSRVLLIGRGYQWCSYDETKLLKDTLAEIDRMLGVNQDKALREKSYRTDLQYCESLFFQMLEERLVEGARRFY